MAAAVDSDELPGEAGEGLPSYSYRLRDDFLSPAEASFFRVLAQAVPADMLLFPKVRLADLVYAPKQTSQYGAWQKINRKHVDFVLSDAATLRPQLVIELDDRSHRRADRIERDAFVDGIFAEVGLPILRVPAGYAYSAAQLRARIETALGGGARPESRRDVPDAGASGERVAPSCKRCGGAMIRRTAKQGQHAGGQFWGCTNYPRCRNVVAVAEDLPALVGD